jgi:hypothetical protein
MCRSCGCYVVSAARSDVVGTSCSTDATLCYVSFTLMKNIETFLCVFHADEEHCNLAMCLSCCNGPDEHILEITFLL